MGNMDNAMNMAATGVGLGIMTYGAMIPLGVMKRTMGGQPPRKRKARRKKRARRR